MKTRIFAIAGAAAAILASGCATESRYVDSGDTTRAVLNKNHLSQADFEKAVEKLGYDLLASPQFAAYLQDYAQDALEKLKKADASGEQLTTRERRNAVKPILMLSDIENRSGDHVEIQVLSNRLREILFNSNKVRFTTYAGGSGQHIDAASANARDMKYDPNVKKSTLMKKNKVNAYDLSLGGAIIKQRASSGRAHEVTYMFTLTLTDSSSGEGVWTKAVEIKRQHMDGGFGY